MTQRNHRALVILRQFDNESTTAVANEAVRGNTVEGRYRVGVLTELPAVLREFGVDAEKVAARAGVSRDVLDNPENALSFIELGRLLETAVEAAGCPHLGLLIGQRGSSASLGLVGRLMRNAPTLGTAVLDFCTHQTRYTHGAVGYLMSQGETSYWGYAVYVPKITAVEQVTDGAIAVGAAIVKELAGVSPEAVWLARRAPQVIAPYCRCFGVIPRFDAEQSALLFPSGFLARPVRGADHGLRQALMKSVTQYWAVRQPSIKDRVTRILRARVMFGGLSLEETARELLIHPRTLNRKLESEGTSFRALLGRARFDAASDLLAGTRMPVTELALVLGYADTSAFTHAFKRWANASPREWRIRYG